MAVKLSFEDSAQVVRISGALTDLEVKALTEKIQEKYVSGRTYFVFDLSEFFIHELSALKALKTIFEFCLSLKTTSIHAGLSQEHWTKLILSDGHVPKGFSNKSEALSFIRSLVNAAIQKKEDQDDPEVLAKREGRIREVIGKYESFFENEVKLPVDLIALLNEYRIRPGLFILKEYAAAARNLEEELKQLPDLESVGAKDIEELTEATLSRKKNLSAGELQSRIKETIEARRKIQTEISQTENEVVLALNEGKEWNKKIFAEKAKVSQKTAEYEKMLEDKRARLKKMNK